jgi:Disulphide bond corrector protein DsbC
MNKTFHFLTACAFSILACLFFPTSAFAQNSNPLGLQITKNKLDPDFGDTVEFVFKAKIPAGWHLYGSQSDCPADDGPIRAEITLEPGNYTLIGKLQEIGSHLKKDTEVWNCTTSEFADSCEFRITIRIEGPIENLKAHLYAQKCSDTDGMCLMVKEEITLPILVPHSKPIRK